jgi:hypothetical protein
MKAAALALLVLLGGATRGAATESCRMEAADRAWLQAALGAWDEAATLLGRELARLPWAIFYDDRCAWHLEPRKAKDARGSEIRFRFQGGAVDVREAPYEKSFRLPDGQARSPAAAAFTSLADDGGTFFVMALPSVWRRDPRTRPDEDVLAFATGVMLHEMTHTLHLPAIAARVEKLAEQARVPARLDDDELQRVFEKNGPYVKDYEDEMATYAEAYGTRDATTARRRLRAALEKSERRRSRYFVGEHAIFRELEPMFLNMEGVASWVAYKTGPDRDTDPATFAGRFWSQKQGLLLFLLLDRFDPGWKKVVFDASVPSPFEMLEAAAARSGP